MRVIYYCTGPISTNDKQAKLCSEVHVWPDISQQMICLQVNRQDMRQQNHWHKSMKLTHSKLLAFTSLVKFSMFTMVETGSFRGTTTTTTTIIFWILMVQGNITEVDTPTVQLGATLSELISEPPPSSPHFYAGCPSCRSPANLCWLGTGTGICLIAYPVAWSTVLSISFEIRPPNKQKTVKLRQIWNMKWVTEWLVDQLTFKNTEICFVFFFSGVRDDAGESCSTIKTQTRG